MPNTLTNPGLFDKITIDSGTTQLGIRDITFFPQAVQITPDILQAPFEVAAGRTVFTSPYLGDNHPDQPTDVTIALPWPEFELAQGPDVAFLKKIRKLGRVIQLAPWLQDYEFYTAPAGQDVFYLPRRHAASLMGKNEGTFGVSFTVNGVARTVVFKDVLTTSTAVTSGEAWVHRTSRLIKTNPAMVATSEVEVTYYPLYRVRPLTSTIEIRRKGREPLDFVFVETTENT